MKASNERYGRGPVLYALPDIKTLNKVVELTLKNASISIGGVFTAVDDGVLNPQTISIVPGAVIGVSSNEVLAVLLCNLYPEAETPTLHKSLAMTCV